MKSKEFSYTPAHISRDGDLENPTGLCYGRNDPYGGLNWRND